jgi:hypothetical protein
MASYKRKEELHFCEVAAYRTAENNKHLTKSVKELSQEVYVTCKKLLQRLRNEVGGKISGSFADNNLSCAIH